MNWTKEPLHEKGGGNKSAGGNEPAAFSHRAKDVKESVKMSPWV